MPTLYCQAHCQVAQKPTAKNQNLSKSLPALPHRQEKKAQLPTIPILHAAISCKHEH